MAKKTETTKEIKPDVKFEERKPILETKISTSKNGKWIILQTIITKIIHANYMHKVLSKGE